MLALDPRIAAVSCGGAGVQSMRPAILVLSCLVGVATPALAQETLPPAEATAAFEAAGFTRVDGQWQACGDPGTANCQPGATTEVRDLNADGQPEAIVTEGSLYSFGDTETGYSLVSREPDGAWKLITAAPGVPSVLASKGQGGRPDLEIGGPGFCFPVERWNGRVDDDPVGLSSLVSQLSEDAVEDPRPAPADEAVVEGLVRAIILGRIAPHQPMLDDVDDA